MTDPRTDYKEIYIQMMTNLGNAYTTFGPKSPQFQSIAEMVKEFMRRVEKDMEERNCRDLDDTLSSAMEFLKIGEGP
ncbi:hypothetical protein CBS63078_8566 [Aspergillus niger]|uniref:Uncharacterized protein n=3 Tax=Aspergillus niger TaxID=5061 RepID=A2QVA3_ASPNC|nr:hypothetical protein An11g00730 [Aspergillus niger]XP_025450699.1 uncharacterized protein BO96DRAFT_503347 [Aspergillus niger CBS 101883]RDH15854.1 hypothetical protein M747DRAFT_299106 [Aspergillus niger ATCC 13496]KAI2818002.1 hypothetical protein CBS115989_5554 [Aspergillus niger]KAI2845024.1 hypothetical protein CBS11232_7865 [Aspergillus niger]KAI2847386.1 hypothetical protein CBS12448_9376 [Aspergillus niger]KAI2872764.1 hypothetical protein CBS115988_7536 [Aspergillus niger]|eukprot:XP_001394077.1 hypothetical protein ANI_1_1588094 [Aspergillus niger CBS 513.88]